MTTSGRVKSTTTSATAKASRSSPEPSPAISLRPSARSTARHTSEPTRPRAPSTPTLIATHHNLGHARTPDGLPNVDDVDLAI